MDLEASRLIGSFAPLIRYLRRERPRVLVSSMTHANLVALWAARLAGTATPVVVTVHNTMSQASQAAKRRWPGARAVAAAHLLSLVGLRRGRVPRRGGRPGPHVGAAPGPGGGGVQPGDHAGDHGARPRQTPDHPWFAPGQPPVILGVGPTHPTEGLSDAHPGVRRGAAASAPRAWLFSGRGRIARRWRRWSRSSALGDDVSLPGFRDNAMAYIAGSALFVLSSAWEGLPTVLIEALAAGTRVVSTDCPSGPREILQDGRLGALVPVGDVAALASGHESTRWSSRDALVSRPRRWPRSPGTRRWITTSA